MPGTDSESGCWPRLRSSKKRSNPNAKHTGKEIGYETDFKKPNKSEVEPNMIFMFIDRNNSCSYLKMACVVVAG